MNRSLLRQAEAIRQQRILARRKRYPHGRLEPFRHAPLRLTQGGDSLRDLARWLRRYPRIQVAVA